MAPRPALPAALALLSLLAAMPADGQTTDLLKREVAAVGVVERLGATVPLAGAFTDSEGRPVQLGEPGRAPAPPLLQLHELPAPLRPAARRAGPGPARRPAGPARASTSPPSASTRPRSASRWPATSRPWSGRPAAAPAWSRAGASSRGSPGRRGRAGRRGGLQVPLRPEDRRVPAPGHAGRGHRRRPRQRLPARHHLRARRPRARRVDRAASGAVATAAEQRSLGGFLLTCMGFDPADPAPLALKVMRAGGVLAMAFLVSFLGYQALPRRAAPRRRRTRPHDPTPRPARRQPHRRRPRLHARARLQRGRGRGPRLRLPLLDVAPSSWCVIVGVHDPLRGPLPGARRRARRRRPRRTTPPGSRSSGRPSRWPWCS